MLSSAGPDANPETLKTLLCPLFARNVEQQELFYKVFENTWEKAHPQHQLAEDNEPELGDEAEKRGFMAGWRIALVAFVLPVLVGAGILLAVQADLVATVDPPPPTPDSLSTKDSADSEQEIDKPKPNPNPSPGPTPTNTDTNNGQNTQPTPAAPEPNRAEAKAEPGAPVPRLTEEPEMPQWPYEPLYAPNIESLVLSPPTWLELNARLLRWWATGTVLLLLLLIEWLRWRRRQLAARRQKELKPPYTWPIHFEEEPRIELGEAFYQAAHQFRKRVEDRALVLDVSATVNASTRKGGALEVIYSQRTRPAEYLVLIDRSSPKNHQSALFDFMARRLSKSDIHVERFYFDGDLRTCWNESAPGGISLAGLFNHFPNHRLLVFGSGGRFIDPATGQLVPWAGRLKDWKDRALLTPRASKDWGHRELVLNNLFVVLPGTAEGMRELIEHFEQQKPSNLAAWKYDDTLSQPGIDLRGPVETVLTRLHDFLSPELRAWVAACALYPDLYWDLTLYMGEVLEQSGKPLLTLENLSRLSQIGWFREGKMPDAVRQQLMFNEHWLPAQERQRVAAALADLFRKNTPADRNTHAWEKHRMELVLSELMLDPKGAEKRKLVRELRALNESRKRTEFTALMFLNKMTALDFAMPKELRKAFFNKGWVLSGVKPGVRAVVAAVLLLVVWLLPEPETQCPNVASLNNQQYCLGSALDSAWFAANQVPALYNPNHEANFEARDKLGDALAYAPGHESVQAMQEVMDFNKAVYWFNRGSYHKALEELRSIQTTSIVIGDAELSELENALNLLRTGAFPNGFAADKAAESGDSGPGPYPSFQSLAQRQLLLSEELLDYFDPIPRYRHVGYLRGDTLARRLIMNSEALYGYLDAQNNEVITAQYPLAKPFTNGVAPVYKDGMWALIDAEGHPLIKYAYNEIGHISEGYAVVRKGDQYSFLDLNKPREAPKKWVNGRLGPLKNGLATLQINDEVQYVNAQLQVLLANSWQYASDFEDGLAVVHSLKAEGASFQYIRPTGQPPFEERYVQAFPPDEGLLRVRNKNGLWNYLDASGQPISGFWYDTLGVFSEGLALARYEGNWGWINRRGEAVVDYTGNKITKMEAFSEGLAAAYDSDWELWGYIRADGEWQHKPFFATAESFRDGYAAAKYGPKEDRVALIVGYDSIYGLDSYSDFLTVNAGQGNFYVLDGYADLQFRDMQTGFVDDDYPKIGANTMYMVRQQDRYVLGTMDGDVIYDALGNEIPAAEVIHDYNLVGTNPLVAVVEPDTGSYYVNKGNRCVWGCPQLQETQSEPIALGQVFEQEGSEGEAIEIPEGGSGLVASPEGQNGLNQEGQIGIGAGLIGASFNNIEYLEVKSGSYQVVRDKTSGLQGIVNTQTGAVIKPCSFVEIPLIVPNRGNQPVAMVFQEGGLYGMASLNGESSLPVAFTQIDLQSVGQSGSQERTTLRAKLPNGVSITVDDRGYCTSCWGSYEGRELDYNDVGQISAIGKLPQDKIQQVEAPWVLLATDNGQLIHNIWADTIVVSARENEGNLVLVSSKLAVLDGKRKDVLYFSEFNDPFEVDELLYDNAEQESGDQLTPMKYRGSWYFYSLSYLDQSPDFGSFKNARPFSGGLAAVEDNAGWYFANTYGDLMEDRFSAVEDFDGKFAVVRNGSTQGLVYWTPRTELVLTVLEPTYRQVRVVGNSMVIAEGRNREWELYIEEPNVGLKQLKPNNKPISNITVQGNNIVCDQDGSRVIYDFNGNCIKGCK